MAQSPESTTHVALKKSRRYPRAGSGILEPSHRQDWVEVTVKVRRKAPLPEPVPSKPIAKEELAANHGADPKDLDAVEKVLASYGLAVISRNVATCTVKLAGRVSDLETAFGTKLFLVKHGIDFYRGRTGEIHIPLALAGVVTAVLGLDNRPMSKTSTLSQVMATQHIPSADQRRWFLPQELADAYNFPAGDGSGQAIGVLAFAGQYKSQDLQKFLELMGITPAAPS